MQIWWATIRHRIHMSLPYPSCEWYISCPFLILRRASGLLLCLWWFLSRGIIWLEDLLLSYFCDWFLDGKMTARLTTRGVC